MHSFLEWFRLEEFFPIVMIVLILTFVGQQMTSPVSEAYRKARRITAAVFLLYAAMGIYAWGAESLTDLLLIVMRACLAGGVAFGMALVTLGPVAYLIGQAKALIPSKAKPKQFEPQRPTFQSVAIPRDYAAEERAEKERMSKIEDARKVAERFYQEHAELLSETLPQALFTTQMQTRFRSEITPEEAWQAAQGTISDMLPLIEAVRVKQRAIEDEKRKQEEQLAKEKPEDGKTSVQRIAEWHQREKEMLLTLPESDEREDFLRLLDEQSDRMMKNALSEAKP